MTKSEYDILYAEAIKHVDTTNVTSDGNGNDYDGDYFVEIIPNEKNGNYDPVAKMRKNLTQEYYEPLERVVDRFRNVPKR
jgi:hypothetical protein